MPRRARKEIIKIGLAGLETHAGCPAWLEKMFSLSPTRLEPPAWAKIKRRKSENTPSTYFQKKSKISGVGVICAPIPKHGIVPRNLSLKHQIYNKFISHADRNYIIQEMLL